MTVTHAADPMATLYYDGNGNLIDDGVWDFEYDAENRLTKASNATTGTTAQYLYDPMGRRQAKVVGSVTTSFLSDGAEEIAEYDGAGGLLRRYIPGPGTDQPIAMVTPSGGSHLHSYFHTNRQGSTIAMSNDAGTVSEGPYTYDAYGQGASSTGVPFKYTGRRLDPETGLYYYRARYYSAALGRFLQTDPIGYKDQMNLYGYVNNDPGNATDPSGLCANVCTTLIGAAVGAAWETGTYLATADKPTWGGAASAAAKGAYVGGTIGSGAGMIRVLGAGAISTVASEFAKEYFDHGPKMERYGTTPSDAAMVLTADVVLGGANAGLGKWATSTFSPKLSSLAKDGVEAGGADPATKGFVAGSGNKIGEFITDSLHAIVSSIQGTSSGGNGLRSDRKDKEKE